MFTRPHDDEFVNAIPYGTIPKGYGKVTIHQSPIKFPENTITFCQQDSTWVMRITADRRIEVNEGVDVTEAAQKVLEAMQHLLTPQQRTWVGIEKSDMPDGKNPMFDHEYFIAGMVFAAKILEEKNK
jgi:hypothetical protein